jgi:Flp pilus assembly protein TadG
MMMSQGLDAEDPRRHRGMKERWWFRLWAARDGLGAIEFGFIAPVLLLMLLGVLDFGMAFWQQMEIANAADAGAQWGMSNDYNQTSIRSVAQSATNLTGTTITPSNECGCVDSGSNTIHLYGTAGSCTGCPMPASVSSTASNYIVVNAKICYKPLFPTWPGLSYGTDSCASNQISLQAQALVLK